MTLNISVHKNTLLKILKDIYTDTSLGPLLGLKGGTAAHLFYGLNRFSVDLDFDLLVPTGLEGLDENKEVEVFDKVEDIVKNYGTIKERINKKHTLFILLSYSEESQNIKIEINKRGFGSPYEVKNYLGISMLVMRREDMFAHKLAAMTERAKTANRDVFDVHFFLNNNWEINKEILEKRTGVKFADYLKKCVEFVENIPNRRILAGIGELLNEKQKAWARTHLKKDVLFQLKLKLENEKGK